MTQDFLAKSTSYTSVKPPTLRVVPRYDTGDYPEGTGTGEERAEMIVGIDPGVKGGIAALDGRRLVGCMRMPMVTHGKRDLVATDALNAFVRQHVGKEIIRAIVIEAPNSMPKQGLQSTFNFGRHCGSVEGWALQHSCPVQLVTPSVWKKAFALSTDKRASLDRARLEFGPHERWNVLANDGIAEAALIALWWSSAASNSNFGKTA